MVAAAVILPPAFHHPWLNDSKQVSETRREALRPYIEEHALAWAVASCSPAEIDTLNILWASVEAMHRALEQMCRRFGLLPEHVAVDGNRFRPWRDIPYDTYIHGDARLGNIAAASILAKTHRDAMMRQLALTYPVYHWEVNKGYPTAAHRAAIAAVGPCPEHRRTFQLLPPEQLTLSFQ